MEWTSLSLFTVLSEAAVGLVLLYTLFGLTTAAQTKTADYARLARPVLLAAWLTAGAATLLSLTHLGWPLFSFRAIANLGSSWLSREVLLTALFVAGAFVLWLRATVPAWSLFLLSLVGLGATYTSGMIYTLPSIPANAGGFPVLLFLDTTLVTGAAALLLLLAVTKPGQSLSPDWSLPLSLFTLGAIALTATLTLAYTGSASTGTPEAQTQAAQLTSSAWYLLRLLAGLAAPALLLIWSARRPKPAAIAAALPALLLVAGELAGRILFFTSSTFTGINTGF